MAGHALRVFEICRVGDPAAGAGLERKEGDRPLKRAVLEELVRGTWEARRDQGHRLNSGTGVEGGNVDVKEACPYSCNRRYRSIIRERGRVRNWFRH